MTAFNSAILNLYRLYMLMCCPTLSWIQELDNDLRTCKEDFKEFERQDVKYREDLKHMKQKMKKLEDKLEKVR